MKIKFELTFTDKIDSYKCVRDILRLFAGVTVQDMAFDGNYHVKNLDGQNVGTAKITLIDSEREHG